MEKSISSAPFAIVSLYLKARDGHLDPDGEETEVERYKIYNRRDAARRVHRDPALHVKAWLQKDSITAELQKVDKAARQARQEVSLP